jgi:NAD(P)-dependent dehydrogenase (short-subunit alcohol dehydrogenase family)
VARILITGSNTGLGLAAARTLHHDGHHVVVHARNRDRSAELEPLGKAGADLVFGDLADLDETRHLADTVNALEPVDAVIHNAGVYSESTPNRTAEGHPRVLAVNVIAPYLLTARINTPARLIYLSSGMHRSGQSTLDDLDWTRRPWNGTQAYCDSKLLVTTLASAIARRWPHVRSHTVDPGWVPTRMGGPHATDDLALGHDTQVWLATSDDPDAVTTGRYWFHRQPQPPAPASQDPHFQDQLLDTLSHLTGEPIPAPSVEHAAAPTPPTRRRPS